MAARPFHAPFSRLKKVFPQSPSPQPSPPLQESPSDETTLFRSEMAGVVPLSAEARMRVEKTPPARTAQRKIISAEAEALAQLSDLLSGDADFDITDTPEYLEGAVVGLDPRLLRKLRQGEFSRQAYVDLHGMTVAESHAALQQFLAHSVRSGHRCVLIIHGRGRNSPGKTPVLKDRVKLWLSRGRLAKSVLAFATARPRDGGAGALYLLLRRPRTSKMPIWVMEGTTR